MSKLQVLSTINFIVIAAICVYALITKNEGALWGPTAGLLILLAGRMVGDSE